MAIGDLIRSYGYLALAVGAFLEGETVLMLAGAAARLGQLSLPVVVAVATVASFAGDQLYFHLGRRYGVRLLVRFPGLQSRTRRTRELLDRHHVPVILLVRFLYGMRIAGPIAIGMSSVPWLRFLALNLVGAIAWAAAIAGAGYYGAQALSPVLRLIATDKLWGLAGLLFCVLVWRLVRRCRHTARRRPVGRGARTGQ